jgi:hypothetical protein
MRSSNGIPYILTQASDAQFNTFDFESGQSIPQYIYISKEDIFVNPESTQKGSKLYFYPTPNDVYTASLLVKNVLQELSIEDDLSELPDYALRYLRYLLASDYIDVFKTVPSDGFYDKLYRAEKVFKRSNPKDMSVKNTNIFQRDYLLRPKNYYVG